MNEGRDIYDVSDMKDEHEALKEVILNVTVGEKNNEQNLEKLFFSKIRSVVAGKLNMKQCKVEDWLAMAVFNNAEVFVCGMKKPMSVKEAMRMKEWPEWRKAIQKEIQGLINVGVWNEVDRSEVPEGVKVLAGKILLDIKTKDGKIDKLKARYVSRGDLSTQGEHWYESASHQMKNKSMKIQFAIAAAKLYKSGGRRSYVPRSLDIKQAYIKRKRGEKEPRVWMELPEYTDGIGSDRQSGKVAEMKRHLYGEVDGGRAFEREFIEFMNEIGAVATVSDRMVFKYEWNGHESFILVHVDDMLYNGSDDEILDEIFRRATIHFGECTGGGTAEIILGIKITWDYETCKVTLTQRAHIEKFLEEFNYDTEEGIEDYPLPIDETYEENNNERVSKNDYDYFKWCGFANWLSTNTRPDIAEAVNMSGRHAQNPGARHIELQRHTLRYLAGTLDMGISYYGYGIGATVTNKLVAYCAVNERTPTTTCVLLKLNGGPVVWRILKQRVQAKSMKQKEMNATSSAIQEIIWARDMLAELGYYQRCVQLIKSEDVKEVEVELKSINYKKEIDYVKCNVNNGIIWINKIKVNENVANIGTGPMVPYDHYIDIRNKLMGMNIGKVSSKE
jgi:hypothetical protein